MKLSTNSGGLVFHFSSIKRLSSELVAAPLGQGIVHKKQLTDEWVEINEGLPEETHINRLQVHVDQLFACSNKGLYYCNEGTWIPTDLAFACYQYKEYGKIGLAGTSNGLWYTEGQGWNLMMRSDVTVYDFLYLPQFIVLATNEGLSILDRLTSTWMNYRYNSAITSLAVANGIILGVTEHGHLLMGNKRGDFECYRMGNRFIFSVVTLEDQVYVCTDSGLYRISQFRNNLTMVAVKLGCQVTDVDGDDSYLYLATLFEGVQRIER
jgi:ligand-binding sensor domain-containing protein